MNEKGHTYYRGFHIRKHGDKVIAVNSEDGTEQPFKSNNHAKAWIDKYHKGQHSQHSEAAYSGSIQHSGVTLREEESEQFAEATHDVFDVMGGEHGEKLKQIAKQFGGITHPDHPDYFGIPKAKVANFHAAANKAGMYLKHNSPSGLYHYRSRGSVGADGTFQFIEGGVKNSIAGILRHFGYVKHRRGIFKHKHLGDLFNVNGSRWDHSRDTRRIASGHDLETLQSHLEEHHKDD